MGLAYALRTRNGANRGIATLLAGIAIAIVAAVPAAAWAPGSPVATGITELPLALASDQSGNGFAISAGASADSALLLTQRDAVATVPDGVRLAWNPPTPLPGGVDKFTSSTALAESAAAAAAGDGAGALVVRFHADGSDVLRAIVRDPGDRFGDAATIVPGNFRRLGDPVVAISVGGTTVIGFTATRSGGTRVAYASRLAGNDFGTPRVISLTGAGPLATAVGPREAGVIAWTRAGRAELSRIDANGVAGRYKVIGAAATDAGIAAAGNRRGAIVSWEGKRGAVMLLRRGSSSSRVFARAVTARRATGANIRGMAAALDPGGVAYVTWREGTGSKTRILVARSSGTRKFRIDQVAKGSGLGPPVAAARPIGGAIVGWAARTGWQVRKVPAKSGLPIQATVSAPGTSTAVPLDRPFVSAGPGARSDIAWLQPSATSPGFDLATSQDVDP